MNIPVIVKLDTFVTHSMSRFELDSSLRQQARWELYLRGETIKDWAERHGFRTASVYAVLMGRSSGMRGEAHRIAVRLGLKPAAKEREAREALMK